MTERDQMAWALFYHYYGDDYLSPEQAYKDTDAFLAERERQAKTILPTPEKRPLAEVVAMGGDCWLRVGGVNIAVSGESCPDSQFDGKDAWDMGSIIQAADTINRAARRRG